MKFNVQVWLGLLLGLSAFSGMAQNTSAPDVGAGKKRAAVCFACHNADGISKIPGTPHLAGQERDYLESALKAYREGEQRKNPTMNAMAKPLSDRDIQNIAAYYSLQTRMNSGQTALQAAETLERIRKVGTVSGEATPIAVVDAGAPAAAQVATVKTGDVVYKNNCSACHDSGAAGAPKTGDKAVWKARLGQGTATLQQHAIQGFKGMPAKGGCASCSDTDIKLAVEYLVNQSR